MQAAAELLVDGSCSMGEYKYYCTSRLLDMQIQAESSEMKVQVRGEEAAAAKELNGEGCLTIHSGLASSVATMMIIWPLGITVHHFARGKQKQEQGQEQKQKALIWQSQIETRPNPAKRRQRGGSRGPCRPECRAGLQRNRESKEWE